MSEIEKTKKNKFKYFDLIENLWATNNNPIKYGVYLGVQADYFEVLCYNPVMCKPKIVMYDKKDLNQFKLIKHTNIKEILKQTNKEKE